MKKKGNRVKYEPITTDEEYYDHIKYILSVLWAIPSMIDKLPNHVYRPLEAVTEYRKKNGWRFDSCKCGGVDDGQSG